MKLVESMTINTPVAGPVPFAPYDFQQYHLAILRDGQSVIVNKARQMGFSWLHAAYMLERALLHRDQRILVCGYQLQTAERDLKKMRFIFKHLQHPLIKMTRDNRAEIGFSNGSSITASATWATVGCSEVFDLVIFDEAAHVNEFEDAWRAIIPNRAAHGQSIVVSSPKKGSYFQTLWVAATFGKGMLKPMEYPWFVHPERDNAWAATQLASISEMAFRQEYLCKFE